MSKTNQTFRRPENLETYTLLKIFLSLELDDEYAFLVPEGAGDSIMQRVRVTLSRTRTKYRERGYRIKRFRLRSKIEDCSAKGFDLITVWKQKTDSAEMGELIDDILAEKEIDPTEKDEENGESKGSNQAAEIGGAG